jgi:hypothetical protein
MIISVDLSKVLPIARYSDGCRCYRVGGAER